MKKEQIKNIVNQYGIQTDEISEVIDSSHGEDDIRLTYIINHKHVLHCTSSKNITEEFLQDMSRLIERHLSIQIYAPMLYKNNSLNYLTKIEENDQIYNCYMEEYAPYKFINRNEVDFYQAKENILPFLGKLATRYTNIDLSKSFSMWSIIDIPVFNEEIDEKQENINELCMYLSDDLKQRIQYLNNQARKHIKKYFHLLPRCVFQGDLNLSNVLVNEQNEFKGIIDFNMFGTDVNINCFLNESMYYIEEDDFDSYKAQKLIEKIDQIQEKLMSKILEYYSLNEIELKVYEDYKFIIMIGFYPNVMQMIELIKKDDSTQVIQFLELLCNHYEMKWLEYGQI